MRLKALDTRTSTARERRENIILVCITLGSIAGLVILWITA